MTQTDGSQKKWRVLIADDVHETRRSTRLMFSTLDNVEVVAIAANGLQAVEMAKEHRPDIVVMDINMPEMDGLTAYKYISRVYPDTACIVISAERDLETVRTAASLGVQEYLTKPFIVEELEAAIEHIAAHLTELREKNLQPNLEELAAEYSKARRTDDQSMRVFERLAENPQCDVRWLKTLSMIYSIRQEWGKLKSLAERLERESRQ
jgi:YesN/AraC family two-component response regulator